MYMSVCKLIHIRIYVCKYAFMIHIIIMHADSCIYIIMHADMHLAIGRTHFISLRTALKASQCVCVIIEYIRTNMPKYTPCVQYIQLVHTNLSF